MVQFDPHSIMLCVASFRWPAMIVNASATNRRASLRSLET